LASSNALIQTVVADDRRGQVMGLYTMAFVGLAPVGTLLAGTLATSFGAARTVLLGGFCCLAGSLALGRRLRHGQYSSGGRGRRVATSVAATSNADPTAPRSSPAATRHARATPAV